jgi:hypothetical protein
MPELGLGQGLSWGVAVVTWVGRPLVWGLHMTNSGVRYGCYWGLELDQEEFDARCWSWSGATCVLERPGCLIGTRRGARCGSWSQVRRQGEGPYVGPGAGPARFRNPYFEFTSAISIATSTSLLGYGRYALEARNAFKRPLARVSHTFGVRSSIIVHRFISKPCKLFISVWLAIIAHGRIADASMIHRLCDL